MIISGAAHRGMARPVLSVLGVGPEVSNLSHRSRRWTLGRFHVGPAGPWSRSATVDQRALPAARGCRPSPPGDR